MAKRTVPPKMGDQFKGIKIPERPITPEELIVETGINKEAMPFEEVPDSDIGEERPGMQLPPDERDAALNPEIQAETLETKDLIGQLLEQMKKEGKASATDLLMLSMMERLNATFDRMANAQLEAADRIAKATKIQTRPSNDQWPQISPFNLRGDKDYPKPRPKCEFYLPWSVNGDEWTSVTREEAELLNLLLPGDYVVRRNDGTKVKLTVRATYKIDSDTLDKLLMNHDTAFNNDYHWLMPPLPDLLRQVLKQNFKTKGLADLVLTMDEEQVLIDASKNNQGEVVKFAVSQGE